MPKMALLMTWNGTRVGQEPSGSEAETEGLGYGVYRVKKKTPPAASSL